MATDEQTMTREQELAEEFKAGLEPDAVPALAQRIAALELANKQLSDELDQAEEEGASNDDDIVRLRAERDAAIARAEKAEKASKAAKAKVSRGEGVMKPRTIKRFSPEDNLGGDLLREAILTAGKVEIVLSDGKREITGIPPVVVQGEAWREHPLGYMLTEPVEISGPAIGQAGFQIDGYALFIDGEQVAYTKRSDPVNVAGGSKVSLRDDIYFA